MSPYSATLYWVYLGPTKDKPGGTYPLTVSSQHDVKAAAQALCDATGHEQYVVSDFKEHRPCCTCHVQEACYRSTWNEHSDVVHKGQRSNPQLTMVHTCVVCCDRKLTLLGRSTDFPYPYDASYSLLEGCPRWHEQHGSALWCGACDRQLWELRREHPTNDLRDQGAQDLVRALQSSIAGNHDHAKNAIKEAAELFAGASTPFMWAPPGTLDNDLMARATCILTQMLAHMRMWLDSDPGVGTLPQELTATHRLGWEWQECLYLSLRTYDNDPERVAREFLLRFIDTPRIPLMWAKVPIASRRFVANEWVHIIQETMAGEVAWWEQHRHYGGS